MEKGGLHVVSGGSQQQPSHSLPPTKETDDDNSAAVEVERLKAEVVKLKYEETSMREIAEETEECAESLRVYSVDVPSPFVHQSRMSDIAENMEQDSIRLTTLSSRIHQLLRQRSSVSSGEV